MTFRLSFVPHLSEHVSDRFLYDCSGRCPLCMSTEPRTGVAVIQRDPLINLLMCNNCKAISASHMPQSAFLDRYYQNTFSEIYRQYDTKKRITFQDEKRFARHICGYLDTEWVARQENLTVVDFGGGDGTLAFAVASALNSKARITVIDRGPEWIQEGPIRVEKKNSIGSAQHGCHIILASASLEHVPEPHPIIEKLYSLLEPGGYFYARTPFVTPFMKLLDICDFGYPAHLHDLGPEFWGRFAQRVGDDLLPIVSQPSIVETRFTKQPVKTIIAAALKLPAHLEVRMRRAGSQPIWQFVGGWEAVFRKNP